jgi:hypothetical protein
VEEKEVTMYLNSAMRPTNLQRNPWSNLSTMSAVAAPKEGFLSFSPTTIVGDISFLLLCGVGVMLIWPSLPTLGQKIKGLIGGNQ